MANTRKTTSGTYISGFWGAMDNHARCPGVVAGTYCLCPRCDHDGQHTAHLAALAEAADAA
jgi:hypothetical protein